MSELKYIWAKKLKSYEDMERVRVYYTKNDLDQNVDFMNFGKEENNWVLISEEHYGGNKLTKSEEKELAEMLNNNKMVFYEELEND